MPVSQMVGEAALLLLAARRAPGEQRGLPQALRPKSLPQAYAIQQAVSREEGAIGGWHMCAAGPDAGLACAPLPLAALRPEPAVLPIAPNQRVQLRPGLAFRVGRSLSEYDAPFSEREVAAAIESTHPAVLVFDSCIAGAACDSWTAIAESCAIAGIIYGQAVSGLADPVMTELGIVHYSGARHKRILRTVLPGNFLAPLTWLANFGAAWGGGLMVGQMVTLALIAEAIPMQPGKWAKLVIGDFGKIEIRAERAER